MRWIISILFLALIPFFYKNFAIMFVLMYSFAMFCPPVDKLFRKCLKINLWDYVAALLLIVYGLFWIIKRKLRRWGGDLVIVFFLLLQLLLKSFNQIDIKKNS